MRPLIAVLAVVLAATAVGVVMLWPDGQGRAGVAAAAGEVGLTSERFGATVRSVSEEPCSYSTAESPQDCRWVVVVPTDGPDALEPVTLPEINLEQTGYIPEPEAGDRIVVGYEPSTGFYFFAGADRRAALWVLAGVFAVFVLLLGRFRGLRSLISMGLSGLILVGFVAPAILDGGQPLLVAVVAASAIAFAGFYLTHGVTPDTSVALAGTLGALGLTLGISALFFRAARFTGVATEEGAVLSFVSGEIDLSSLLLAGAMLGALGALDDVTITQATTVAELRRADPTMGPRRLTAAGLRVGRAHIASVTNTLLLAYAGAALPLLLLFAVSDQSPQMVANSELIAVEIARTLCGSIGLVAAVPLTTALAAVAGGERRGGSSTAGDGPTRPFAARRLTYRGRRQAQQGNSPADWDDFAPPDDFDF